MEQLPAEVLQHFLLFLAPDEVGGLALVCKGWTEVVDEDYVWKKLFARYFGGKLPQNNPRMDTNDVDSDYLIPTWKQTCINAFHDIHNAITRVLDEQTKQTFTPRDSIKLILEPSELLARQPCVLLVVVEQLAMKGYSIALQRVLSMPIRGKYNAVLHAFAMSSAGGHVEQLQWILGLEPELEINYMHKLTNHFTTALQLAVEHNHLDAVRFLLQRGASNSVSERAHTGRGWRVVATKSACAIAIQNGATDILRLFIDPTMSQQQDNNKRAKMLQGFLEEAVKASNMTAIELLLSQCNPSCNINHLSGLSAGDGVCVPLCAPTPPQQSATPKQAVLPKLTPIGSVLFFAAMTGNVDVARLLLSRGADINLSTRHHRTALHVACYYGHTEMVNFLLENGADASVTTVDGVTPISVAGWQGHDNLLGILLAQELVKRKGKG